jgi:hypothetical protein
MRFYKVHAAHMTCHTQYEYVGCEASKRVVQLDRRGVQHLHSGQYKSWKRGNEWTYNADTFTECAWRKVGSEF